jgi:hypothetical protein
MQLEPLWGNDAKGGVRWDEHVDHLGLSIFVSVQKLGYIK